MTKRSDLEARGDQLIASPRQWAAPYPGGAYIPGYGRTSRTTFESLPNEKRQRLASQIKVNQQTLKELADDAGVIVAIWLLAPTEQDVYSGRQHQAFIEASVEFLERVHRLSRRDVVRPQSEEARAEERLAELASMRVREELTPLMKLINPAWHDPNNWDVRRALRMARSLSDKLPQGEESAGDPRDRLAADSLTASWFEHTKRRPSAGESRPSSPYQFYFNLLGFGSDANPSLLVMPPQGLIPQRRSTFGNEQIQEFRRVVIKERALHRAIQRWLKNPEIHRRTE